MAPYSRGVHSVAMSRYITRSSALPALLVLLTGCQVVGGNDSAPPNARMSDLHFQWNTESSIDLSTGPAVPLRAYLESRVVAYTQGDINSAYPGFADAVPTDDTHGTPSIGMSGLRPSIGPPPKTNPVGNRQFFLRDIRQSPSGFTATVCDYEYAVGREVGDGKYRSIADEEVRDNPGISVLRVDMTRAGTSSPSELPPQLGPAPAPATDVFGGWKVSRFLTRFFTNEPGFLDIWPTYEADLASCVERAPDPPERRQFLTTGEHPRGDFHTSPPRPGWPEA